MRTCGTRSTSFASRKSREPFEKDSFTSLGLENRTAPANLAAPDFTAIKQRQQATWASGDFAVIGTTLQIVGEPLCEAVDVRAGERCSTSLPATATLRSAAARRLARRDFTDYVPALLDKARERARAERLPIEFRVADAEALPFEDGSFDVVLSTFGVMFAPDQPRAAPSCCVSAGRRPDRPGELDTDGFIGQLFKVIGSTCRRPAGLKSPALWGTETRLADLFGRRRADRCERRCFNFRYSSRRTGCKVFRDFYGPSATKLSRRSDAQGQGGAPEDDIIALLKQMNTGR